jgi:hypothetical protein
LTITALFVDRDCPFLRATLAQVRDQWARTGRACPFNGAFSVPRFRCPYGSRARERRAGDNRLGLSARAIVGGRLLSS